MKDKCDALISRILTGIRMKFFKNNKGTSVVEFAIILPVLIVILFGIMEFSLVLYNKAMITNASREGARGGVVFNADSTGDYSPFDETYIRDNIVNPYLGNHLITFSNATATTTVAGSDGSNQCPPLDWPPLNLPPAPRQITVTVNYPYTFLVVPNFVPGLVGFNPLNLTAVSTMKCE